jgi:hypothetical protein
MQSFLRSLFISALLLVAHVLVGCYFPQVYLSLGAVSLPVLLCYVNVFPSCRTQGAVAVFVALLLADHLFRLYGGGTHDQAGKTLCDLALAGSVTIALSWVGYVLTYQGAAAGPSSRRSRTRSCPLGRRAGRLLGIQ